MDNQSGGLSPSERQRKTATEIARKKVLDAYGYSEEKEKKPVQKSISKEDWGKYHSEWQKYYQRYYSEYYSKAAHHYIAKEKLKSERNASDEEKVSKESGAKTHSKDSDKTISELKTKIGNKSKNQASKTRRRKILLPILIGLAVVIVFLFLQYNRLIFAPIVAYMSPGDNAVSEITAIDPTITQAVSPDPRLIIPKLNIDVPVSFGISNDSNTIMSAMNNGVAHFAIPGADAYPGEIGNLVISGHSAGDIYSNNQYKFIFSGLERLESGDLIYVNYQSVRYTYKVVKKDVVEPTDVAALVYETNKPMLTLITCTPLGTSRYRLLVTAEQISPSYEEKTFTPENEKPKNNAEMPSNEETFFEGIWNFLTGN